MNMPLNRLNSQPALTAVIDMIEEGRSLKAVAGFVIAAAVIAAVISRGIYTDAPDRTVIYDKNAQEKFTPRKVSEIPKELEASEAEKIIDDDRRISPADARDRYVSYVIARLEAGKIYPLEDQKRGRESSVVLRLLVLRDGTVKKVTIVRPARYQSLTDAAIATVKKSIPLAAFPPQVDDAELKINVEINFVLR